MALEPYKDKGWMFDYYVKRRLNLTDIAKVLQKSYNITVTPQTLYNWAKKHELLKYRGKGRKLGANTQGGKRPARGKMGTGMTEQRAKIERMKRKNKSRKR